MNEAEETDLLTDFYKKAINAAKTNEDIRQIEKWMEFDFGKLKPQEGE